MKIKITILLNLISLSFFAQSITAQLIDASNQQPIPYANIKTGPYAGVISNDEGYFTVAAVDDTRNITISCMGYKNQTLSIGALKQLNFIIEMSVALNQLDEVYISNKAPNVDSIIARVKARIHKNYNYELNQYDIFKRTTNHVDFESLEFEIDKASQVKKKQLQDVNNSLTALVNQVKSSNMVQFDDFKGKIYTLDKDSIKLEVEKATELLDHKNDFSIDNIQERMQNIILRYLDTTKTYKLKTGLFKIEDSLKLNDEDFKENDKNEYTMSFLNNETKALLRRSQVYNNSFLDKILNTDLYEYRFEDVGNNNGELTYIVSFIPRKGKAKYTGKLHIAEDSYAIIRIDYNYYKNRHGDKFNLRLILGVKYIENKSTGTMIFEKDSSNIYHPKYINRTSGSYFYLSRPLKFIENSEKRYKVAFDFTIEGDNYTKEELLISGYNKLTFLDFQAERQKEKTPVIKLNKYDKTIWDDEGILEPSLEMKTFQSEK